MRVVSCPNYADFLTARFRIGKDATEAFEDVGHSDEARALLPDMLVGDFEQNGVRVYSYLLALYC